MITIQLKRTMQGWYDQTNGKDGLCDSVLHRLYEDLPTAMGSLVDLEFHSRKKKGTLPIKMIGTECRLLDMDERHYILQDMREAMTEAGVREYRVYHVRFMCAV